MLNYWRKKGIAGHKILAFAALDPRNIEHVKQSVYLFGGTYIGVQLPLSAQAQDIWDVPSTGPTGDGEPGSWGGHAVCVVAYNATGLWVVTWGKLQFMTWAFWHTYCDEAYAVFSTDMLAKGKSPAGFDLPQLQADLAEIGKTEQIPRRCEEGKRTRSFSSKTKESFSPFFHSESSRKFKRIPRRCKEGIRTRRLVSKTMELFSPFFHSVSPRRSAVETDLVIVIFTGFGTDPAGDCDGMRALATKITRQLPNSNCQILTFGYDQIPPAPYSASPDGLCRWILDQLIALAPTRLIALRHSFGGALGVFFDQWLWNWYGGPDKLSPPFTFDQIIFFDPVPNPIRFGEGQFPGWSVPITIAPNVLCFYQREGLLLGIKGEPLLPRPGVTNIDVTPWTNPQLAHIDFLWLTGIIDDARVRAITLSHTQALDAPCAVASDTSI